MTKKKSTKSALLMSVLAMVLCVSMLIGTTFAWFTDSVTSANNIITAGNLDIELEYWDGEEWVDVSGKSNVLTNNLWEPGVTEVAYLRIANAGSLALKYQFGINIVSETEGKNVAGETFKLSKYIQFGVVNDVNGKTNAYATREEAVAAVTDAKPISFGYTSSASMQAGDELYLALVVYMPTTVGNEANHDGEHIPQIDLGINIIATQFTSERDSFGEDYDKDATFVTAPVARPENATNTMNLKGANDVVISLPKEVINNLPEGVEEIGMAVSDPVINTNDKIVTFASIELVDQDGKVIDLGTLDTSAEITVTLPLPKEAPFAAGEEVLIYHDGTYVATAIVGQNGTLSYGVAHLCEVTVSTIELPEEKNGVIEIANAAQLVAFAQSVNAGNSYKGKKVVLADDIDLNNVAWTPIGNWDNTFEGTFDGNNKVISNLYINDADGDGVGFFGVVENATIKNLTIKNVDINAYSMVAGVVGAAYPATISNCHIAGDVEIVSDWAYVAGVAGYCYYGTQVDGCSTVADKTGLIKSVTRNAVGGITAWLLEGKHNVTNCTVKNLDLVGWTNVGGITGFVHYNNTISGCTVENVTLTKTRVDGNPGIGLIAGGWSYSASNPITIKNNTVSSVTMNGNHKSYAAYNELYGSEYDGATTTNFVLEDNTTAKVENNLTTYTVVKTGDELKAAIANGDCGIIFANNITMKAAISNGYGVTGIVVDGQTINGNGYTLTVTGAGGTWDSAIYIKGGKVENMKIAGAMRGVFMGTANEDVYLENVSFDTVYTFNSDGANKNYGVYISNSTMNGWTSHSDCHKEVVYTNCTFTKGNGYAFCRPYGPTKFIDCEFAAGFTVDKSQTTALTFENCTFRAE